MNRKVIEMLLSFILGGIVSILLTLSVNKQDSMIKQYKFICDARTYSLDLDYIYSSRIYCDSVEMETANSCIVFVDGVPMKILADIIYINSNK